MEFIDSFISIFGGVLLGFSPMDLSSLPEETYEDAVAIGGEQVGWTEGQVRFSLAHVKLGSSARVQLLVGFLQARAIWMTLVRRSNMTADQAVNMTDRDIALLGSFVAQIG